MAKTTTRKVSRPWLTPPLILASLADRTVGIAQAVVGACLNAVDPNGNSHYHSPIDNCTKRIRKHSQLLSEHPLFSDPQLLLQLREMFKNNKSVDDFPQLLLYHQRHVFSRPSNNNRLEGRFNDYDFVTQNRPNLALANISTIQIARNLLVLPARAQVGARFELPILLLIIPELSDAILFSAPQHSTNNNFLDLWSLATSLAATSIEIFSPPPTQNSQRTCHATTLLPFLLMPSH